jgi:hypothetical protein
VQIDVNLATLSLAASALGSVILATWALSRRSQNWDQTEAHDKLLHGDKDSKDPLLNRGIVGVLRDFLGVAPGEPLPEVKYKTALQSITSLADQQKRFARGTGAHGSDEHAIAKNFRTSVASEVEAALEEMQREEARRTRLRLLQEQAQRFGESELLEGDPFPSEPEPVQRRLGPGGSKGGRRPIPREEPEDDPNERPSRPGAIPVGRRGRRDGGE